MILPAWALFGFGTAVLSALMMLLQERFKLNGYALAFWNKAGCLIVTFPFVLHYGLPPDPRFLIYLFITAIIYAISDVVFFSAIPKSSAGAVARLIPASSVLTFLLWFAIDPSLFFKYANAPIISGLIFITLCLFGFFAFRLKKCAVTMETLRNVWFVIFAATTGALLTKITTYYANMEQGIYAYVFFQALMMMALWLLYLFVRKPVSLGTFFAKATWQRGLIIGMVSAGMVLMKFTSYFFVDNPAYIPAIIALDSVIIVLIYKYSGRPIEGDLVAGLGIVGCAVALIVLKTLI